MKLFRIITAAALAVIIVCALVSCGCASDAADADDTGAAAAETVSLEPAGELPDNFIPCARVLFAPGEVQDPAAMIKLEQEAVAKDPLYEFLDAAVFAGPFGGTDAFAELAEALSAQDFDVAVPGFVYDGEDGSAAALDAASGLKNNRDVTINDVHIITFSAGDEDEKADNYSWLTSALTADISAEPDCTVFVFTCDGSEELDGIVRDYPNVYVFRTGDAVFAQTAGCTFFTVGGLTRDAYLVAEADLHGRVSVHVVDPASDTVSSDTRWFIG